jgi:hypothetical protein
MEPHDVETLIRHLTAMLVKQDVINDDLRESIRQQGGINERLTTAIERLDITQARIETLLARMLPQGDNGREA